MGKGNASAPTLANPGNSFGTAGSGVVESSERIALCWTTVTTIGQMADTRVPGKVDKWNSSGKAWPKWSFVMKAYDVAVDQHLSGAKISTDVVSNVQFGGVHPVTKQGGEQDALNQATRAWNLESLQNKIRKIISPASINQAMEVQVEAEHIKRAESLWK